MSEQKKELSDEQKMMLGVLDLFEADHELRRAVVVVKTALDMRDTTKPHFVFPKAVRKDIIRQLQKANKVIFNAIELFNIDGETNGKEG